jgi:uncharacterized phage protein (TIGR01671 family)
MNNRVIKFRAWNTGQKRMFTAEEMSEDQLTLDVNNRGFANIHSDPRKSEFSGDKMIALQFTGLNDKNGTEIYEGDIVKIMRQGTAFIGEVKWGTAGFFILTKQLPNLFQFSEIHDEIIGNIYENQDLLK